MTYKSLFTVLTDENLAEPTLRQASAMAAAHDAHLEVLCLGVDRNHAGYYYAGASAVMFEETLSRAQDEVDRIDAAARRVLNNSDIRWSCQSDISQLADLTRHVSARARFSDLVILPQPYGESSGAEMEPATEACLFDGQTPVLILPGDSSAKSASPRPKKIVVAWNESLEALNAVRAALPLLKSAEEVHVVVVDPPKHGSDQADPGGMLSQYLARHDVTVTVDLLPNTMPRVIDTLSRHATEKQAEMIVMGAYGHSRFRQAVFGGATRAMLEEAVLPVLMAH